MFQPSHPSEIPSGSSIGTSSGDDDQLDGHVQKSSSFERLDGRKVREYTLSDHPVAMREVKPESILIDRYGDNVLNDFDVHPSFQSNRLETDRPTASDNVANDVATSESPDDTAQLISDERYPEDQFDRKGSPELDSADQTTRRRRLSLTTPTGQRETTDTSFGKRSPGLNRLPNLRRRPTDYADRESAREVVRRRKASDETITRRQEDLDAAESSLLYLEAGREQRPRLTHHESSGRERSSSPLRSSRVTTQYVAEGSKGRKFYYDTREEAESKVLQLSHEQRVELLRRGAAVESSSASVR
jgi:hypothetical protein